jgi:MFS family permease
MSQANLIFLTVLTTSFLGPFMGSSINIAIPSIAETFVFPPAMLSWVVTAYLLGSVAVLVPFGKLADSIGRKKIYQSGLICLLVTTCLAGFSVSLPMLIAFRLLQGLSLAMIFSTGMAILISGHTAQDRGKVIGYSAAATYMGLSLGPVIGGLLTQYLGWRAIFFFTAAGLLVSLVAIGKVKVEWYGVKGEKLDVVGSFLYCTSSIAVLYGLSAYALNPWAVGILGSGVLLLVLFVYEQTKSHQPIIELYLFRNTIFAMSNLAAMIHYSSTFAIGFVLSLYLQVVRGFDASTTGLILLIQPLLMTIFSPWAGALSDKIQPRFVASAGMFLTMLGLFFFTFLTQQTPIWLLGVNLILIGIGFAFFSSPNSNAVMGSVAPPIYGVASSILSVMRLSGQALSMAVVTVILSLYPQTTGVSAAVMLHSFTVIFAVQAFCCGCGVFVSLARGT